MKRILMVIDAYYPTDIRLKKEIDSLLSNQIKITLACYRREGEAVKENLDGLEVVRTEEVITSRKKGFIDIRNAITFVNKPIWELLNSLKNQHFDAVHAHDLSVSNTALKFAKSIDAVSVFDMHENYPEALVIWFEWRKSPLIRLKNKLFFNYNTWIKREKEMSQSFDHIIAVVDEMKDRLMALYGLPTQKLTIVSNTEPKALFDTVPDESIQNYKEKTIVYVGGIGPHRGIDTAIEGMKILKDFGLEFKMVIVGSGVQDNITYLKQLAVKLGIEDRVEFTGQLPYRQAIAYMKGAFLNMIPHHSNPHTDNTIPHKLFQIFNSEYPLIVSSCMPLKRIVEEYDSGIVFEAGDPESFALKVKWASENPEKLIEMTKNGHKAVHEGRYNWETDAKVLQAMYNRILD